MPALSHMGQDGYYSCHIEMLSNYSMERLTHIPVVRSAKFFGDLVEYFRGHRKVLAPTFAYRHSRFLEKTPNPGLAKPGLARPAPASTGKRCFLGLAKPGLARLGLASPGKSVFLGLVKPGLARPGLAALASPRIWAGPPWPWLGQPINNQPASQLAS